MYFREKSVFLVTERNLIWRSVRYSIYIVRPRLLDTQFAPRWRSTRSTAVGNASVRWYSWAQITAAAKFEDDTLLSETRHFTLRNTLTTFTSIYLKHCLYFFYGFKLSSRKLHRSIWRCYLVMNGFQILGKFDLSNDHYGNIFWQESVSVSHLKFRQV